MFIDNAGISAVPDLLFLCGPYAVVWLVISIIVFALNALARRASPHVFKEVLEYLPSIANPYASRTVILVGLGVLVLAPLSHSAPNIVGSSSGKAVPCIGPDASDFILKASAGLCSAVSHISTIAINDISTVTLQSPYGSSAFATSSGADCCQSAKSLPSNIGQFHMCNSTNKFLGAQMITREELAAMRCCLNDDCADFYRITK